MQILITPHSFLKHKAKEVKAWDKKTIKEVIEMEKILKKTTDPKGVGLAATQVGLDKRIFLLLQEDETHIYVNPQVTFSSKKKLSHIYKNKRDRWLEGCLSIPKIWGFVDRAYSIKLKFQVPQLIGEEWQLIDQEKDFIDIESAYVQHETDHLDGILFTDHVLEQKGQLFKETEEGLTPISF